MIWSPMVGLEFNKSIKHMYTVSCALALHNCCITNTIDQLHVSTDVYVFCHTYIYIHMCIYIERDDVPLAHIPLAPPRTPADVG